MYILSVEIQNIRTFESARIAFGVPGGESGSDAEALSNVSVLLGDNGSGKATVLRAVALAALSPVMTTSSGFVPYALVRRSGGREPKLGRITAELLLHAQDGQEGRQRLETTLTPTRGWNDRFRTEDTPKWVEAMWEEDSPAFLVTGYGSSRRVEPNAGFPEELRSKSRALRYQRVASLFEEGVTLTPLSSWLPRLRAANRDRYAEVISLLNELLAPHAELQSENYSEEPLFRIGGANLPFPALSDGYRAYVGWIADLLYHLSMGTPGNRALVECRGVVLVDEIDLHLHPEWQQRVIPTVARALPLLQFIFTSHSPLVVGTLRGASLFVLDSEVSEGIARTVIRRSDEAVYGLSSDQILTSGNFGLDSPRDPDFTRHLYEQARAARDGDSAEALQFLRLMSLGAAAEEEQSAYAEASTSRDASPDLPPER